MVIAGTGPAACACAVELRRKGVSVTLIGPSPTSDGRLECVDGAIDRLLKFVPDSARLLDESTAVRVSAIRSRWGTDSEVERDIGMRPSGPARSIKRSVLDAGLLTRAVDAGAKWWCGRISDIRRINTGVLISWRDRRGINQEVSASMFVDATGASARFAQELGGVRVDDDAMLALWTKVNAKLIEPTTIRVHVVSYGWWFVLPAAKDQIQVALMTDPKTVRESRLLDGDTFTRAILSTEFSKAFRGSPLDRPIRTTAVRSGSLVEPAGDGWLAVGDSSFSIDPLGSAGLMLALLSGARGGVAIAGALSGATKPLNDFCDWTRSQRQRYLVERSLQYSIVRDIDRSPFWSGRYVALSRNPAWRRGGEESINHNRGSNRGPT